MNEPSHIYTAWLLTIFALESIFSLPWAEWDSTSKYCFVEHYRSFHSNTSTKVPVVTTLKLDITLSIHVPHWFSVTTLIADRKKTLLIFILSVSVSHTISIVNLSFFFFIFSVSKYFSNIISIINLNVLFFIFSVSKYFLISFQLSI